MVGVGEMWRLRNGPLTKSVKFYNSQEKISAESKIKYLHISTPYDIHLKLINVECQLYLNFKN